MVDSVVDFFVVLVDFSLTVPDEAAGALPLAPARTEQTGHAPHPWARWTLLATAICADLDAWSAVAA